LREGRGPALSPAASANRRRLAAALCAVAAASLVAGCAGGRGGRIPYNVSPTVFGNPDSPATTVLEDDYHVAPLDTLKVLVFQVPDLSGEFQVDLTGNIAMPLLGNVKVVDMTTSQINDKLARMLGAKYLQHPDVNVGVKSSSTRNVTVDGSVKQAGVIPVTGPLTLLQVIAMAHGPDDSANPHRVAVFRKIKGERMAAAFDLVSIRRGEAEDPRIYAGDIVVVDGSKIKSTWSTILSALPLLAFRPFGI
jgi:polysaccharide export outer membrane protein